MLTVMAKDLKEGDMVDLESCPIFKDKMEAEFEMAEVLEVETAADGKIHVGYESHGIAVYDPQDALQVVHTSRLYDPTIQQFQDAYKALTGSEALPGRVDKLFRTMNASSNDRTVFGTCEVVWTKDDDSKEVVILQQ